MTFRFGFWTSNWTATIAKPIILPEINPRNRIKLILTIFLISWFHFIVIFEVGIQINKYKTCNTSQCGKNQLALILSSLFLLITWYSLLLKRESLKKLFKEQNKFEDFFSNGNLLKQRKIINWITFGYLFVGTAAMTTILIYFTTDEDLIRKWYKSFNIFEASFQVQRMLFFMYTASNRIFLIHLPGVMMLLYLSYFSSLTVALCVCEKEMARPRGGKFFRRFVDMYSVVNDLASSAESAFSLTTFFLSCYYFSSIYITFSDLYYRPLAYDVIVQIEKAFTDIVQSLLFESTIVVASEVHSRDVGLRRKLKEKIYKMSLSASASRYSENLSRFMDSKPLIIFTAFKMFSFTRTFLLTATGVALTYSLLILQFNSTDEKSTKCQ